MMPEAAGASARTQLSAGLLQVGLNPLRRVMDVDRLKAARPQIFELVRHARRTEHDLSGGRLDHGIADEEACAALYHDEGLVIGMDMKPRTNADLVGAISKHRDRPVEGPPGNRSSPRSSSSGIEQCCS